MGENKWYVKVKDLHSEKYVLDDSLESGRDKKEKR